jgi:hypothetical protein
MRLRITAATAAAVTAALLAVGFASAGASMTSATCVIGGKTTAAWKAGPPVNGVYLDYRMQSGAFLPSVFVAPAKGAKSATYTTPDSDPANPIASVDVTLTDAKGAASPTVTVACA